MNECDRAEVLLRAAYQLLDKQNQSSYVLNILETTVNYDDAECDGSCLMEDIEAWFFGKRKGNLGQCKRIKTTAK